MSSFNENLEKISLTEALIVLILSYLFIFALRFFHIIDIGIAAVNVIVILYFALKLKNYAHDLKSDISDIFSVISFREMIMIVLLNIFFSYGMLYLSNCLVRFIPPGSFLFPAKSIGGFAGLFSLVSVILISPIAEELVFRGIFLNKLKLVVPTVFAVLISSLLFASLHSFGGIISAFVFGVCMAVLYLKTGNILVPILAHFINNLLSETIFHFDYLNLLFSSDIVMVLVSGLAVVSFVVLFKFIKSNLKNI